MEEMSLESVSKELDKLENDKRYILNRMDNILSLVLPKGTNTDSLRVDGGQRIDKLLKYTDLKDEMSLDDRLSFVNDKIEDLEQWKKEELKRLNKYDDLIKQVVFYREEMFIKDKRTGKVRHLTWQEIARNCFVDEKTARRKYKIAIEGRKSKDNINYQDTKKEA